MDLENISSTQRAELILDFFHRTIIHHGLWYAEVMHQMGQEKANELLHEVSQRSLSIQLNHLAKLFGFEMEGAIPKPLLTMEDADQVALLERVAKNWLVGDGVWFQAIEASEGMNDAKRCNDSCWARFSPFEASSIKKLLDLGPQPGLEGLEKALALRLYGTINTQSIVERTDDSFVFQMNVCRVQAARKRKGLNDYPCKSGGLVEYSYFAKAIDARIVTQCIGCPPDEHPAEWYCAWKFSLVTE